MDLLKLLLGHANIDMNTVRDVVSVTVCQLIKTCFVWRVACVLNVEVWKCMIASSQYSNGTISIVSMKAYSFSNETNVCMTYVLWIIFLLVGWRYSFACCRKRRSLWYFAVTTWTSQCYRYEYHDKQCEYSCTIAYICAHVNRMIAKIISSKHFWM